MHGLTTRTSLLAGAKGTRWYETLARPAGIAAGCGCAGLPFDGVKPATARLDLHGGVCSATYIGPATILTARHCIATDAGTFNIDGERAGYALLADDKQDHVMLRVTVRRRVWAHMGPDPRSGDQVFKRGNPWGCTTF